MLVGLVCLLLVVIGFFAVHVKAASIYENIESYTEFDGEPLTHPYGMAIDSNGNIYVTDYANERIVIFNEDGTSKGEIPVGYGQLTLMRIKDDILYVVIQATNILRFDLNNNNEIIGKTLTVPQAISGLAIDSEGNIFANMYHYLYKFSPDGNQERYFFYGDFDEESRFFNSKGIALDEDDNLYVLAGNDYIHRWDKNKNYLGRWDYAYAYDFNGLFYHKGELYLTAETYTKRGFQKISATSGEILNTYTEDARGYLVFDIAVHPLTERVYVTYVRHAEPSGVWVYKDNGTTITLNVSSDEVQYGDDVTISVSVTGNDYVAPIPTGVIRIKDGAEELMELDLINGQADFTTSSLLPGDRMIRAVYSGDDHFPEDSSEEIQIKVNKIPSTTTLQSSNPNIGAGESVTFTATVSGSGPGGETPTGTVTFMDGGEVLAVEALVDGTATVNVNNLASGERTITALYSGDSMFQESEQTIQQTVEKVSTVTNVTASPALSKYGENVTITATVTSSNNGIPTGNVKFTNGATELGTTILDNGSASLDVSNLLVGDHTITVEYEGDSSYSASSSTIALKIEKANTTTVLTTSESSSSYGENVSFTVAVTANAPGSGTPTGEVTFKNEDKVLGIATLNDGTATLSGVNNLSVGSHTITAHYSGDGSFIPSDGAVVQTVTGATVTMNVTTSIPTSLFGEEVTYTVKVTPKISNLDQPTGEVTFINGTEELGKVPLTNGIAALSVTNLMVGEHTISVIYSGDHIYDSESTTVQQLVNKANTTTNATTSDDRSIFGEKVTLTATVTVEAPGRGTPSGTVTFKHGAEEFGTAVLDGGTASLDISTLPVGEYEILVQYNGDHSFLASSDTIDQEVNQASSTTSIVASTSSSVSGENVTFTATVESSSHGTPSGHVKFMNGTQELGEVALRDGTATLTGITNLSVGDHTVTAEYSGDSSFLPSRDTVQHTVNKAITTTNVTAAKTDILEGESITLTANVMVNSPGTGIPTGKVTFLQKTEVIGEVILTSADAGVAELLLPKGLDVGRYEVHVQYDGDARFLKSQSKAVVLTVSRRSSSSDGDTSFPSTPSQPTQPRQVVATDGKIILPPRASGAVSLGKNITVTLPARLSNEEVRLTIEELVEYTEFISEDHELLSNVYEILSSLTGTFSKAITITIVFDPTMLNEGQKASIFYFDEANEEWIEVGGVVNGNKISATIDHLTKFAVFAVDDSSPPQSETDLAVTLSDIRGHWAESSIVKAIESGIVNGYPDGTFRPNKPVTRAEFTVMLMNGLKLDIHPSDVNFTDRSQIGTWAIQAISQAVQAEIIRGYEDGSFKPNANINRTEMVVMIANALDIRTEHLTATSFSDDKDIPTWAKGAVETIRNLGIVSGRSNDLFVPKENATRAEAITIILKMLEQK